MKKLVYIFSILLALCLASPQVNAAVFKAATCLTGSANCLDAISGSGLSAGDGAVVVYNDGGTYKGYLYVVVESSATEDVPNVITPDTSAGTKRWHLTHSITADTYADLVAKWASGSCSGYLKSDGTCNSGDNLGTSTYVDIMGLWGSCTGYLKSDGTCVSSTGSGGTSTGDDNIWTGENTFSGDLNIGISTGILYVTSGAVSTETTLSGLVYGGFTVSQAACSDVNGNLTTCTALPVTTLEVGHASDTTIARASAGVVSVEGLSLPRIIASGATVLDFGSTTTGACATVIQATATNAVSTDVIIFNPNASIKAVTGYVPSSAGGFSITAFPTSGYVNFEACNWTSGTVDPSSITVNWMVIR